MTATAVIGPGRVGTALGMALDAAGYHVVAVAGRRSQRVRDFVARVPSAAAVSPTEAVRRAQLVVLAVPDDALAGVVAAVAAGGSVGAGRRVVHVAGGHGTAVLAAVRDAGAAVAACHPAQTFPDADAGLAALPGTAWAVTADPPDRSWAYALVTDLGGRPVLVADEARALYPAALAVGATATATVVAIARELLYAAGVGDPTAPPPPPARAAAANAAAAGPAAITGPVRRGDAATVAAHLAAVRAAVPDAADAYRDLARLALVQARRAGLDAVSADAVAAVLRP